MKSKVTLNDKYEKWEDGISRDIKELEYRFSSHCNDNTGIIFDLDSIVITDRTIETTDGLVTVVYCNFSDNSKYSIHELVHWWQTHKFWTNSVSALNVNGKVLVLDIIGNPLLKLNKL